MGIFLGCLIALIYTKIYNIRIEYIKTKAKNDSIYIYKGNVKDSLEFTISKDSLYESDSSVYAFNGLITDPQTANAVGVSILEDIYGNMYNQKPFLISGLNNTVWFINGSAINRRSEAGCCGYGTIMLQQADGMVIFYIHSK